MKAPDLISIQPNAHDAWFEGNKPSDIFVEYIRKDVLIKMVDEAITHLSDGSLAGYYESLAYQDIKEKINEI